MYYAPVLPQMVEYSKYGHPLCAVIPTVLVSGIDTNGDNLPDNPEFPIDISEKLCVNTLIVSYSTN